MLPRFVWHECQLEDLCESLTPPAEVVLTSLHGSARALALAACQVGTGRTFLVLCRSDEVAAALHRDLIFFLGDGVALLPEREADLEARADGLRPCTGSRIARPPSWSPRSRRRCFARSARRSWKRRGLALSAADRPREILLRALAAGGYRTVGQVTGAGEFAVRGGILDCFPPALDQPVRVEFFGTRSIRCATSIRRPTRSLGPASQATLLPLQEFS